MLAGLAPFSSYSFSSCSFVILRPLLSFSCLLFSLVLFSSSCLIFNSFVSLVSFVGCCFTFGLYNSCLIHTLPDRWWNGGEGFSLKEG